ncbi:MAG: glycerol-3-phosphate acyltransferase [Alphaproteobacteria bacterium BRH_c36]|nr:MAG: glycerol-3-phosphate acyltransferase [Alphaproteobacteria bacterium BRH_c36]
MIESSVTALAVGFGAGYLVGSVPFGLLLTRLAGLGDIRSMGSGNIGATNVLRTGHKGLAVATLLLDALKGTLAVMAGALLYGAPSLPGGDGALLGAAAGGYGAFLGHLFPVWLGFKGGKGVATYIGVLLGLLAKLALLFCGIWLAVAVATRYSSLSALIAAAIVPIAAYVWGGTLLAGVTLLMSVLLIWKHHPNIKRLLAGEETRIGGKAKG